MPDVWTCPAPLRASERIMIGHGGGGLLTAELIEHLFLPGFGRAAAGATATDSAVLDVGDQRIAFTTDSYVVRPLFFPGGNIGDLAINGTVNDLAMAGAQPLAISTAFVLEEGLDIELLHRVVATMGDAAERAGVRLVTGDTKVVDAGLADGMYITTSGIGVVPAGVDLRPERIAAGDRVIVSGQLGLHGIAVLSVREGLEFGTDMVTDSAPLNGLVAAMLNRDDSSLHALRDLTRGGLAAALCELAESASVGIVYEEAALPIPIAVAAGCGFLGLDPVHVANEGRLVAFVAPDQADCVLAAMQGQPYGADAVVVGEVTADHPGVVVAHTALGARRVINRPLGEQLPRIC